MRAQNFLAKFLHSIDEISRRKIIDLMKNISSKWFFEENFLCNGEFCLHYDEISSHCDDLLKNLDAVR
jgi:hypothetical protein